MKRYPAYRSTRLNWLEHVPAHWEEMRAKHYFVEVNERSQTGSEELLSVSHLTGVTPRSEKDVTMFMAETYVGHKLCQPGDLVINSLWAWMGAAGISRHFGIVSSAYGVYRLRDHILFIPKYLDYLLRTKGYAGEYFCRSNGVWTSRLQLTPSDFFDVPIIRPPRAEQDAIVAFLDRKLAEIDRFIAAKQQLIALLQDQRAAIINRAVTRGLDPNAPMKPSGIEWLGDVPAHWEGSELRYLTDPNRKIMYGIVLPGPDVPDGVLLVKGGNCEPGRLRPELMARVAFEIEQEYEKSRLRPGDLVYAIRGSIGAVEMLPSNVNHANLTQDAARIAPGRHVHGRWLLYTLRSSTLFSQVSARAVGATIRGVNIRDLKRARLIVPPIQEQVEIAAYLDNETSQIADAVVRAEREIELIKEYRATLISDAVTGKIDVRAEVAEGVRA